MKKAVIFDLGGTLVNYFELNDFPKILKQAIHEVYSFLHQRGLVSSSIAEIWGRVGDENFESKNHRVRPLENRLINIFQLPKSVYSSALISDMCRSFMKPIFSLGYCYEDTIPTLQKLRSMGFKTAVISNTTWGSPGYLWMEEIERLGLANYLDHIIFCRDVGWRKPAKPVFRYALKKLAVDPVECIFIGDDPRWDLKGPRNVGIESILINRRGLNYGYEVKTIQLLSELFEFLR